MRVAVLVVLVGAGFLCAVLGARMGPSRVVAQQPYVAKAASATPAARLIAFSCQLGQGHQQITLIDPEARVMSVYHVDGATGEISLQSVRNVRWDLQMEEFNGASPSPREIRSLLEQR